MAQSIASTLTDGKLFSSSFPAVMQHKDKLVKLLFAPVMEFKGEEPELMQQWANRPRAL